MKPFRLLLLEPARAAPAARLAALGVGLVLAMAGCASPPRIDRRDPDLDRALSLARAAQAAGAADTAADSYRQALARAWVMDRPDLVAPCAYNLAACLAALGRYEEARAWLDEARQNAARAGLPLSEAALLEARLARAQGRPEEAEALLRAGQTTAAFAHEDVRLSASLLLAELRADQGDSAGAEAALEPVSLRALERAEPAVRAEAAAIEARLRVLKRQPAAAGPLFDNAADQWRKAGRYLDMARALDQAARAYAGAGQHQSAADRTLRAARSLLENGRPGEARALLARTPPWHAMPDGASLQRQWDRLHRNVEAAAHGDQGAR